VAIVIAALAGPQWLFTEEKLPNANYNGTANFKAMDDGAYITKYTKSSLWILCTSLPGGCCRTAFLFLSSSASVDKEDGCVLKWLGFSVWVGGFIFFF